MTAAESPAYTPSDATPEDHVVAGFAALAIVIHILEAAVPSPVPGIKPGLANVVTLVVLLRYGWRLAAWVAALRVLAGSLLIGTFLTPTFMLSLAGASASVAALGAGTRLPGRLGPLGFGVLGATAHIAGQVLIAWLVIVPHPGVLDLLPVLLALGLLLGLVSGIITHQILTRLEVATASAGQ